MKMTAHLFSAFFLLSGVTGCVSSYKHVVVAVMDSTTRAPISGAKVVTAYSRGSIFSRASGKPSEATTDASGKAVVKGNFLPYEPLLFPWHDDWIFKPSFEVSIHTPEYRANIYATCSYDFGRTLLARPANFIPTAPDKVIEITGEKIQSQRLIEFRKEQKEEERKANALFQKPPTFWPSHGSPPYAFVNDSVGELLVKKRWAAASKIPLGTQKDDEAIRAAVLRHMVISKATVNEVRWLSSSLVMVSSGWYAGPLASAGYTYVLKKSRNGEWTVVTHYMNYIS